MPFYLPYTYNSWYSNYNFIIMKIADRFFFIEGFYAVEWEITFHVKF